MSYQIAYTTQFHSLKNVLWKIDIYINDYVGRPVEIKLDGDEKLLKMYPKWGLFDKNCLYLSCQPQKLYKTLN